MIHKLSHINTAAIGLIATGLLAYYNIFDGVWIFDDYSYVIDNPFVRQLWVFGTGYPHPYRPVLEWTFSLNYALGGLDITGYHAFNLCIHLLATLTLFGVIRRTLPGISGNRYGSSAAPLAFVIALLWMIHPLQTESVTYISQRSESLVSLLMLICLYGIIHAAHTERPVYRYIWYGMAVGAFLLGCGVKEIIAAGLPLLILYDRIFLSDSWAMVHRKRWIVYFLCLGGLMWLVGSSDRFRTTPETLLILAVIVFIINLAFGRMYHAGSQSARLWVQRGLLIGGGLIILVAVLIAVNQLQGSMEQYTSVTMARYAMSQLGVIAHYLRLVFWPVPLILDHDWPVVPSWTALGATAWLTVLGFALTLWSLWKYPRIGFLGASFFLLLAPTSSFIPLRDLAVEHRMYLPLASIITLVILAANALIHRIRDDRSNTVRLAVQGVLVAGAALALGVRTVDRNVDYTRPVALWTQALNRYPDHKRVHLNLAQIYTQQEDHETAYRHYQQGLPFTWLKEELGAKVYYNFGVTLQALNQIANAETQYRLAVGLEPEGIVAASSYNQLGMLAAGRNNLTQARSLFEAARDAVPAYAIAYKNLGVLYAMQNRWGRAQAQLTEAVRLDPDFTDAHFALAEVLEQRGRTSEAIASYEKVLLLDPDHTEARKRLTVLR